MAKNYNVKINDFKNIKIKKQLEEKQLEVVQVLEEKYNCTIKKVLCKGSGIVLAIVEGGKYIITGRPCYQKSIIDILKSVNIIEDNIIIDNNNTQKDITIEDLQSILQ